MKGNKRLLKFDVNGKNVKDFRLPNSARPDGGFFPALTSDGDFFIRTGNKCTLDAYNIFDREMKKRYSLLGKKECDRSVILEVRKQDYLAWSSFNSFFTHYDVVQDNRLIVYLAHDSTVYFFKQGMLVKKYNIWPKKALELYRNTIEVHSKNLKKNDLLVAFMFLNFFLDKDNEDYFYLECRGDTTEDGKERFLYQFDLNGNLGKVFYSPVGGRFVFKKNNLFYAVKEDNIYIFKEEKK